jgi:2-polyprenyl-3-methyl-5-hydroxy-6-metoxy-1,4-benzoquinol methylase
VSAGNYRIETDPEFGFRRVSPTPSKEEITRYYAEEFYSGEYKRFNNSELKVQLEDREFLDGHRDDVLDGLEEVLGESIVGKRVLDVGCGWAQNLSYFQERGMECSGFDPAPEAVAHARDSGLRVEVAGMDKMSVFPGERFDVVTLFHVLEHLGDPAAALREIQTSVLAPGGALVIEVPNDFNAMQRAAVEVHGLDEWWIAPPAHLNYFNNETLCNLLRGTGFEPVLSEATFPLEMFLLFGDNYVAERELGRLCHQKRVAFETNLRRSHRTDTLRTLYRALAQAHLGRTVVVHSRSAAS